ncbi:Glycine betaine transporter OpuD [Olavius algarvensis associated proteobacterium Delta 3]|nr:Glycine betaine transporter OpuD [Olavius algarvensis associated proteobacterium Delta 3]
MFFNPLLLIAVGLTLAVAVWGIVDTAGLTQLATDYVRLVFRSRGWFVMLTATTLLLVCGWLAVSRYGRIRLGKDDDQPEFSTMSWLTMMFAAGMGVGLLFFGAAEPITHYLFLVSAKVVPVQSATWALFITNFHWGLHAWAIYGLTGLVIAYFGFRKGTPQLISAPIKTVFAGEKWSAGVGWLVDLLSIYAIAIGLAGSVAMGVFQVQDGIAALFNWEQTGLTLSLAVFGVLVLAYIVPLTVDLSKGMALLSNTAIVIAVGLMLYLLLVGPTHFLMNGIVEAIGTYISGVIPHGFNTFTFYDEQVESWFGDWTLNYMVWWLAWSPFVGVFIARISKGRTIREFLAGVLLAPTVFSIFWFGIFGGMGFFKGGAEKLDPSVVASNINQTTFLLLDTLPLSALTTIATIVAAFLFIVTSVVSAAYVLAMFSTGGDQNPSVKIKLIWGAILGLLGLSMILSDSVSAVRQIIALSAGPFVFIVILLMVCLLKSLKKEVE